MEKELEALEYICKILNEKSIDLKWLFKEQYNTIKQSLQELQAIKSAEPSEAMEWLDKFKGIEISAMPFKDDCGTQEVDLNEVRFVGSQLNNDFHKFVNTLENYILKSQGQSIVEKMAIKELVSNHIIDHNSIVEVYETDKEDPHYSNKIFTGMAWEMEKHPVGNRKLKHIFSALAETISDSDRICIEVEDE